MVNFEKIGNTIWNVILKVASGKELDQNQSIGKGKTDDKLKVYEELFDETDKTNKQKITERKTKYEDLVNAYYDLATYFYEYGWGQSFHFAPRFKGETFKESIVKHEYYLAMKLALKTTDKVLDVGCGVGGPLRNISRFAGCSITGINNNMYQVCRANILNKEAKIDDRCQVQKGNFMNLGFDEKFDKCYAIEATCHAPDKTKCFKQIFKALKPGGTFACYEWCMTNKYDKTSAKQRAIKLQIEKGDGLPELPMPEEMVQSMKDAGFVNIEYFDCAEVAPKWIGNNVNWYSTLEGGISFSQFKLTKVGRFITDKGVQVLEKLKIAPKGTHKTHKMLIETADALVAGGKTNIFTPMFFLKGDKPAKKDEEEKEN